MSENSFLGLSIPNLDAEDPQTLGDLASTMRLLTLYCENKGAAMNARLIGNIPAAIGFEKTCERLYNRLPVALRW